MRILFLNYEYPPLGGGGSNATKYLLRELARNKNIVIDAVVSSATGSFEKEAIAGNVTVHKLPIKKKSIHYWTQREVLDYTRKCMSYIKQLPLEEYDVCHTFFGIPCGAIAYLHRRKIPYVVSLRGSDVPGFNSRFSALYTVLKPIIRRVWRSAEAVVANSHDLAELAKKTDRTVTIEVIPNGVDTGEFHPESHPSNVQRHDGVLRCICVSRLIERKGVGYLIEAAKLLREQNISCTMTIVGKGDLEESLRQQSESDGTGSTVAFLGYVSHDSLPDLYRNHDVFILPSLNEGMSNALLEAAASGLAIITTDTGGVRELTGNAGNDRNEGGMIIVPQRNAPAIADAVIRLCSRKQLERSKQASLRIAKQLSWKNVAKEYLKVYERIASKK